MMTMRNALLATCTALSLMLLTATTAAESLSQWTPRPADWKGAGVTDDSARAAFRIDGKQQTAALTQMCRVVLNLNELVYPD